MKFIHVLPVLAIAAAFGAAQALPSSHASQSLARQPSPELAAGVPPWLDPHAGIYPEPEPALEEDPYRRVGLEPTPEVSVATVERSRAANGRSVAEIFASRAKLAGQTLRVRGTVVKRNEGILGKTYLHLRDGSGNADQGDDDLTATSTESFELGETVELEGELAVDQDVGAGYVYAALLTNATRVIP